MIHDPERTYKPNSTCEDSSSASRVARSMEPGPVQIWTHCQAQNRHDQLPYHEVQSIGPKTYPFSKRHFKFSAHRHPRGWKQQRSHVKYTNQWSLPCKCYFTELIVTQIGTSAPSCLHLSIQPYTCNLSDTFCPAIELHDHDQYLTPSAFRNMNATH